MKKVFSFICATLFIVISITSCGLSNGKSIMISKVLIFNNPLSILNYYESYIEKMTYIEDDNNSFSYSIYIEESDKSGVYNICEMNENNTFYAYNGNLYSSENGEVYSIVQAFGTYSEVTLKYIETRNTDFDNLISYQKYSKEYVKNGTNIIEVAYTAKMTPTIATKYHSLGIDISDQIVIVYKIEKTTNLFLNVSYYRTSGENQTLFLSRDYTYNDSKKEMFSVIPIDNDTIDISIVFSPNTESESKSNYKILSNTKLGIDSQDKSVKYFVDSECKIPFDYKTYTPMNGAVIYAMYD